MDKDGEMGSVYIINDHGKLGRRGDALAFSYPNGEERRIFPHRTDRLIIAASVELTAPALKLIMRHRIDTIFISKNGLFNGRLDFQDSKNVFLRKRQYELLADENAQIKLVAALIQGKIRNQISFMQRIGRKLDDQDIERAIHSAQGNLENVEGASNINSLRGYEGYGSRLFFSVFKKNINPDWANFQGRSMHPPKDNVNAVLSFLYTLLLYRVDAAIETEGLDPYVGYLHTIGYGKRALTFDLMEEYRTSICDTLCCALFNLGILKQDDFEKKEFDISDEDALLEAPLGDAEGQQPAASIDPEYGVLLTKEGLKKVAGKFEEKMETLILYPPESERLSYQRIILAQVQHYKRVIMGSEPAYQPFILK